jgi:hypothetical protein
MKGGDDGWMRRGRAISTATNGPRLTSIRGSPYHWGHPGGTHFPRALRVCVVRRTGWRDWQRAERGGVGWWWRGWLEL